MGRVAFLVFLSLILVLYQVQRAASSEEIELGRLIIDQSRTRAGHEFLQDFCSFWEDLPGQQTNYTIIVKEVPSVQFGSSITVELNGIVVYRSVLRTRSGDIYSAAMSAARNARLLLLQLEQRRINGENNDSEDKL